MSSGDTDGPRTRRTIKTKQKAAASDAVRHEWARRVEAEYRSAAITQHLTLWLIQIGVSPDLVEAGLRIVRDELAHARLSHRVFSAAGGSTMSPIARETLAITSGEGAPLEERVTRSCVEIFCLGETVAVPLFKVLREGCNVPVARVALDRVLRDEVRHRDFGWALLEHLLEQPYRATVVSLVERELPNMFRRLSRSYAPSGGSATIPDADRAWGLMPVKRYGEILARAVERDYVPRFGRHGFDAARAWKTSQAPKEAAAASAASPLTSNGEATKPRGSAQG